MAIHSTRSELEKAFNDHKGVVSEDAAQPTLHPSRQLLLFYAAECGLKAKYLTLISKNSTADFAGHTPSINTSSWKAYGYGHNLEIWFSALRIPAHAVPGRTGTQPLPNSDLQEKLKYGNHLGAADSAQINFLHSLVDYLEKNP